MNILIENVSKNFGDFLALDHVNLEIQTGCLVALVGSSGSGKSTLLRIIAGLDTPSHGRIWLTGRDSSFMSIQEREIGFVFQNYALFKHMTVYENIAFGLKSEFSSDSLKTESTKNIYEIKSKQKNKETSEPSSELNYKSHNSKFMCDNNQYWGSESNTPLKKIKEKGTIVLKDDTKANRINQLLHLIQLEDFADRYPNQLSGGQRQRVAFARALAIQPKFLLLDEPFGALDMKVRKDLRNWLKNLHRQIALTTIFVTHDHQEALEIANEIVVFKKGRIQILGKPQDVYKYLIKKK